MASGYSQGGQVVGDGLDRGGGVLFNGCIQPANAGQNPSTLPGSKSGLFTI